jgi:hypothetical protein
VLDPLLRDRETIQLLSQGTSTSDDRAKFRSSASKPATLNRKDYPKVFWNEKEYNKDVKKKKGETDGLNIKAKKRGRPKTVNEDDDDYSADATAHPYLQHPDGSLISSAEIAALSQKGRRIWNAFLKAKLAPAKYGDMPHDLHAYFVIEMISDPKFFFLLLCDDLEWKLLKWTRKAYSSWALRKDLRTKKTKENSDSPTLDTSGLLEIDQNLMPDESDDDTPLTSSPSGAATQAESRTTTEDPRLLPACIFADPLANIPDLAKSSSSFADPLRYVHIFMRTVY